mmetsp:Transcript_99920/g.278082  ORF Transcript_99920/g.278082 Transcript_99920/m.278082 type:complete len:214 (-) Transcript_99920:234-875(-)
MRRRALLQAMPQRRCNDGALGPRALAEQHRRRAGEEEAADAAAVDLLGAGQLRREAPEATLEHGVEGRQPDAASDLHQRRPPARAGSAHQAPHLRLTAVHCAEAVAALELADGAGAPAREPRGRRGVDADAVAVVEHRHVDRLRGGGGVADGGMARLGGGELVELVVRLLLDPLEQLPAVELHAGVLEIVALLDGVGEHDGRDVVTTPLVVPL